MYWCSPIPACGVGEANNLKIRDVLSFEDGKGKRNYRIKVRGKTDEHDAIMRASAAKSVLWLRLGKFKDKRSDHVAEGTHEAANEFHGQIAEMTPEKDFGFVMTKEGGLLYFHRNSVISGDFGRLKRGDEVTYVEEMGDTGPTASKVRVAGR